MKQINGLLTQKPTSAEPQVGDVRRFSYQERKSKTGTPWIKIKGEGEGYGEPYEIKRVAKTDYIDQHGNVSFNLTIEPIMVDPTSSEPPGYDAPEPPQWDRCEKLSDPPATAQNHSDGIMEAKKHLLASARLYNLCVDAARTVVEDHAKQFWPDGLGGEMFRTCVSSLFIEATRAGMLEKMK